MAYHKVSVVFYIDGEGRDEEIVAQGMSEGVRPFGPISDIMNAFPEGTYLGAEVESVSVPSDEELQPYV